MTLLFSQAAELDEITLLADTRDNDLDPEVSAQLVQANVRAYFSFRKKGKSRGKGKFPVRSTPLPLSDRRQQPKELRENIECICLRSKRTFGTTITNAQLFH